MDYAQMRSGLKLRGRAVLLAIGYELQMVKVPLPTPSWS